MVATALYPVPMRLRPLAELVGIALLTAALLSTQSVSETVGGGWAEKLLLPARMALLILVCTWLLRRGGERWADLGLRMPATLWKVPLLMLGGYALIGATVTALTVLVLPALGAPRPDMSAFQALRGDKAEYLYWLIPVALGSAAVGEELLMRGFVLNRFARLLGHAGGAPYAAIVAQAALFGVLHAYQGIGGVLTTFAVGLGIGLVYRWGGANLWACILLHGLIDAVTMTAFYLGRVPA
ncbi:MAG TPA: type II CAAX endopeptidase family protein [Azospirillaceae bacterium]|nr:type II CAAX endopeptidase family protein [Azospirillaceae bacterium]